MHSISTLFCDFHYTAFSVILTQVEPQFNLIVYLSKADIIYHVYGVCLKIISYGDSKVLKGLSVNPLRQLLQESEIRI